MIPLRYGDAVQAGLDGLHVDALAAIDRFDLHLLVMRRSASTRRAYAAAVVRWLLAGGQPGHVDAALLARFLARRRAGRAIATINMDLKALRAFYRVQVTWGESSLADVARIARQRKPPVRIVRYLTDAQVGEVFAVCPEGFTGQRDLAILMTLYVTGIRAGELARMQTSHIIDDDLLFIPAGKGGHDRYVPMGETLGAAMGRYLTQRSLLRPGKLQAMWLRGNGRQLASGRSIWEIVSKRIWQALGVRAGLHRVNRGGRPWTGHFPHELRASFATALLHNGASLPAIAQLLGHANLATTAAYTGVDMAHLRGAMAHHPRALRLGASGSAAKPERNARNDSRLSALQVVTPTAPKRIR